MRKILAIVIITLIVLLAFSVGCDNSPKRKLVSSRPVRNTADTTPKASAPVQNPEADPEPKPAQKQVIDDRILTGEYVPPPEGERAECEQLTGTELWQIMGGTWTKTDSCPTYPAMPSGVSVCTCAYAGNKKFVDIETQRYDDAAQALKVFNMYCSGQEMSSVATNACKAEKTDYTRPNTVYFLKEEYFVKVQCMGTCSLATVEEIAVKLYPKI